ncbi:MAG TPA: creatininase family protein [Thermomicrobiales bacterium]|nr:creatininase family protein [Thermomicrobiales bacterium]
MAGQGNSEVRWQKLRRDEIAALAVRDPVVLLPIGAIEQHGPHLPVDTDTNSVSTIAERAAHQVGPDVALVLPPIHWGLSPYWMPFAGTITLRPETILALISDIGCSVSAHGFRRMVIINGHGGNGGIIGVAATQLADHGIRAVALSYWALLGSELSSITPADHGHIGHAGQTETSIQLHLQPERVDPVYSSFTSWADLSTMADDLLTPGAYKPPLPLVESPTGVYGDLTQAQAELGELIVDLVTDRLADLIRAFPLSQPGGETQG